MRGVKHEVGIVTTQHAILTTALGRWLNVSEIEALLNPDATILPLSTSPPSTPPPSGSLFLYNRSVTRNYKDDGYKWIKKRNSHKVREDHVKLRVGGKFRVSGCYVHGSDVPTLHRRAYHLLDPDTGTALYPVSNSSNRNNTPSLVLVHYLDTKLASQHTANMMNSKNISTDSSARMHNNSPPRNSNTTSFFGHSNANSYPVEVSSSSVSPGQPNCYSALVSTNESQFQGSTSSFTVSASDMHINPADLHGAFSSNSMLGLETLDFLWDVIFTEGEDKLEQTLANSNFPVDPSMIKEMIDAREEGQDTYAHGNGAPPHQNNSLSDRADANTDHHADVSGSEHMVEIVDITPNTALINSQTNVVISCSESVSNPENNQNGGSFAWYTLAAFVSVTEESEHENPRAISIDLFRVKRLNPYAFKTEVSSIGQQEHRHIVLVAVFLDSSTDPVCKGVAASIGHVLEQSWRVHRRSGDRSSKGWLHLSSSSHPVVKDRPFIRFLTQMSEDPFRFMAPKAEQNTHVTPTIVEPKDLPAPPSHMALVATALSDFPNPPAKAVLPPLTTMSFTGPNDKQQTKPLCETDESPETKRIIQASMEATVHENHPTSKKRPNSSIEIGPSAVVDVPVAASAWASKPSSMPKIDTKAEEVDRHCKIRFVERLTDVIAEAEPTAAPVNNDEIKSMDDEELDDILDGLLVRIVESLDEISSSSTCNDVMEELNFEDKSGFALLHYAALYNLSSLISVLLSRGANPDIQTSRGNLTPLHLACGAGNTKIVELLVRNGCALNLPDSFGSYPVDHARRNGFTAVAEYLLARITNEKALKSASLESNGNGTVQTNAATPSISGGYEQEKVLIQSAFANLSLKDKLIFNMMVRKRRRDDGTKPGDSPTIMEGDDEDDEETSDDPTTINEYDGAPLGTNSDVEMISCEDEIGGAKLKNKMRQNKSDTWEEDSVGSVLSNTDQESLDIAMKLMNKEELDDIHRKSADDDVDLREWMMKRNYESLMEAKQHLQKTLTKHGENKGKSCVAKGAKDNAATVRSLQNMKSQALAGLVIRKNVTKRKNPVEQKLSVVKDEPEG